MTTLHINWIFESGMSRQVQIEEQYLSDAEKHVDDLYNSLGQKNGVILTAEDRLKNIDNKIIGFLSDEVRSHKVDEGDLLQCSLYYIAKRSPRNIGTKNLQHSYFIFSIENAVFTFQPFDDESAYKEGVAVFQKYILTARVSGPFNDLAVIHQIAQNDRFRLIYNKEGNTFDIYGQYDSLKLRKVSGCNKSHFLESFEYMLFVATGAARVARADVELPKITHFVVRDVHTLDIVKIHELPKYTIRIPPNAFPNAQDFENGRKALDAAMDSTDMRIILGNLGASPYGWVSLDRAKDALREAFRREKLPFDEASRDAFQNTANNTMNLAEHPRHWPSEAKRRSPNKQKKFNLEESYIWVRDMINLLTNKVLS